jgi:lambda repressor-like predicted transcriptional regulator
MDLSAAAGKGVSEMTGQGEQAVEQGTQRVESTVLLSHRTRRKLERLEQDYQRYQEMQVQNHRGYQSVDAIKKCVEDAESFCEADIEAGRVADTPQFWANIYLQVLVSVKAKAGSLMGNLALYVLRTGGGRPGEQAAFAEAQRALSRLAAEIERKLADAREDEDTEREHAPDPAGKKLTNRRDWTRALMMGNGLSINDLAVQAGLAFHTVDSYLKGCRSYPSTRKKLAKALGIRVEDLPI